MTYKVAKNYKHTITSAHPTHISYTTRLITLVGLN